MNLLKKYIWLAINLALACVLLALVGGRLFFVMKGYWQERGKLNAAKVSLDQLYQRETFPSPANIIREENKLADLIYEYNGLNSWLADDQVLPADMKKTEFLNFLEKSLQRIRDRLKTGHVAIPENEKYTFGFAKYVAGKPPLTENIPRLVQQLKMTERICQLLTESSVKELLLFSRDEFENAAGSSREQPSSGRQPPSPAAGPGKDRPAAQLYSAQHFTMAFRASEGSMLDLLNRLARQPMFIVVTRVEINNLRHNKTWAGSASSRSPADGQAKPGGPSTVDELARAQRPIALGQEEVGVKLEMNVYNFGPPIDFSKNNQKKRAGK